MPRLTPDQMADVIDKWYENGRKGLARLLEAGDLEEAKAAAARWFEQGDKRIGSLRRQLKGLDK